MPNWLKEIRERHKVLRYFFHGIKCPGYRDLNKCQISAHPGLNSCQMPKGGGGGGEMGTLGFDSYITHILIIFMQIRYIEVFDLMNPTYNKRISSVPW